MSQGRLTRCDTTSMFLYRRKIGLRLFAMDAETGALEPVDSFEAEGRPAPLAIDPQRGFIYVASREALQLSSYRIDQGSGRLSPVGSVPLDTDPCYLATDRNGRFLLSAYYGGGQGGGPPNWWKWCYRDAARSSRARPLRARTPCRLTRPTDSPSSPTSPAPTDLTGSISSGSMRTPAVSLRTRRQW